MALAQQAEATGQDIQDEITTALEGDQISAVREVVRAEDYPVEIQVGAHLEAAACRHLGQVRPTQQDAFGVWPDLCLALVADGMGGRPAGEVASARAVQHVYSFFANADPEKTPPMAFDTTQGFAAGLLARAVERANWAIHAAGQQTATHQGMGTTVAALLLAGPNAVIAHVGDSRVYRFHNGILTQLTQDHSKAEEYQRWRGAAADPEVTKANQRFLTQAIGLSPTVRVSVRVEPLRPGDLFLLCTDGLWNCVSHIEIAQTLTQATSHGATHETLATATQTLLTQANQAGGLDNITVVLVRPLPGPFVGTEENLDAPVPMITAARLPHSRTPPIRQSKRGVPLF